MIKAIIQAGFGNQLFQYATGYALAKYLGQRLVLDTSFFDYVKGSNADNIRTNNLNLLQLDNPEFVSAPQSYWKYRYGVLLRKTPFWRLLGFTSKVVWEDVSKCREFQAELFNEIERYKDFEIYGFWQNTMYFKDVITDLKRQFVPNYQLSDYVCKLTAEISTNVNSVGVHIRRGDFVRLGWNKGADYYRNAMNTMRQSLVNPHFYICTDDKTWAHDEFNSDRDVEIIDITTTTKDIDEFFSLSKCHHQIISESTFGWWAAYLNMHTDKRIIIPNDAQGEIFNQTNWTRI